ncbi:MAG: HAD family phosphatase [Pirellulales bacterium]|nr:HAD family phosphatase [Pirellulales bacterium]
MKPSFLYFDLGNVLLTFSHERMCAQMAAVAGVAPEVVRRALFESTGETSVQGRFERGELNALAVYEHFCEAAGVRPDREELFAAGSDMFAEIPASVAIIERLAAAGRRLGVLSNTNPIDWGFVTSGRFPFLNRCFEQAVLSFEVRAMKPERAIYDAAVERAGVPANEVFFTDDREENVAGAIAAGLDAVLFISPEQLVEELNRRGLTS